MGGVPALGALQPGSLLLLAAVDLVDLTKDQVAAKRRHRDRAAAGPAAVDPVHRLPDLGVFVSGKP